MIKEEAMKWITLGCVVAMGAIRVCSSADISLSDDLKMEYVRYATNYMNPYEWENQSWWSNRWCVAAIFFDINNDGQCDAMVATPDQMLDRSFTWLPLYKETNGTITIESNITNAEWVSCCADALYAATLGDNVKVLVGRDAYVEKYESGKRVWRKSSDIRFRMNGNGNFKTQFLANGIGGIVLNTGFQKLELVHPECYVGYDLKLERPDETYDPWRKKLREEAPAPVPPPGFQAFARDYAARVRQRLGPKRSVTVYAVFFDVDKDGDADFYVTSDAEAVTSARYKWTLYINRGTAFEKAKERAWFNRGTAHDAAMLEPEDTSRRNAFYLFERKRGDDQIHVLESGRDGLHSHAYLKLLSEDDRQRRPPNDREHKDQTEDWQCEMEKKYGHVPPKDFREQLEESYRVRRLKCWEFVEEAK